VASGDGNFFPGVLSGFRGIATMTMKIRMVVSARGMKGGSGHAFGLRCADSLFPGIAYALADIASLL